MTIYIDADSFPANARSVIIRAAERKSINACFVARKDPGLPKSKIVIFMQAPEEADGADNLIFAQATKGDLVFTRDIPFAARLVEQGILVLNDRGSVWTKENIRARLSERDFMAGLRDANLASMGKKGYGSRELQDFSNAFDRELNKLLRLNA